MIYEANDTIRRDMEWAACRRLAQLRAREPFAYLDWVINELEEFHMRGWKRVPRHFLPSLLAVREIQPGRVVVPERWPGLIRDAIEKCFNIQEQLLQLRDPQRTRAVEADPDQDSVAVVAEPQLA